MQRDLDAQTLLTTTRAVRRRIDFDREVPLETLRECVAVAVQAPVGGEEWHPHFIVIDDPETRQKIAALYQEINLPYLADIESKALAAADPGDHARIRKDHELFRWHGETMGRVPALVIAGIMGRYEEQSQIFQASAYGSVLPAAWSFMLAARARGLGATWTTLHLAHADAIAEILGLPENFTQAVMLPVGFYKGDSFKRAPRPPLEGFFHHNRW